MAKMTNQHPDLDVILVNGDMLGHGIPMDQYHGYSDSQKLAYFNSVKSVIGTVANLLAQYFP
jgi:hypothetical protein